VRRGCREACEAVLRIERLEDLVERLLPSPRVELDASLIARADEGVARAARGPRHVAKLAEALELADVDPHELLDLHPADARDEAQVIVRAAAIVARSPPCAHLAVGRGLGIDRRGFRLLERDRLLEAALHE